MTHLQDWVTTATKTASNGVTKQTIEGAGVSLVRVTVPAGYAASRHHHDHEQLVQVLSGAGELETEQGTRGFGPGSIFFFPAGTETVLVETNLRA